MSFPQGNSPPNQNPHIRLNSDSGDLLGMNDSSSSPAGQDVTRQPSSRSLIPPQSRPTSLRQQRSTNSLYTGQTPAESAELLLPPTRSRTRRFRDDDDDPTPSPSLSGYNSRRTSWSSESAGSRDSRYGGPFVSPFDDSRAPSRAGSDDDGVNTQTVSEKYNILPSAGLLLFPEDVEKDDYLHNPDPNEKEGRITCADLMSPRGLMNIGGLAMITLGITFLFIGYPILCVLPLVIFPCPFQSLDTRLGFVAVLTRKQDLCATIHCAKDQPMYGKPPVYQRRRVAFEESPYRPH